ncbi:major capsid and protease fusion protein [Gordonia phage Rickmore]|uniref:Major capsid and protease fusion protein n=1 Tax=Gordonia phage Rickmore TaxID=2507854 RepID=A0A410TB63_9CAUD|nr:head maturation protease [Gordonia phage Rickmore]QAU06255.1 major capsid and protease fusion protein [Gordonia phage Rickmore]
MEPDFSGFATKANLRCSDGRTILSDAFKHMDGTKVPLVWQHAHNEPSNVLGHMQLEARGGDVYGYGFFNDSDAAVNAKSLVKHGDITALSIYANKLVEKDKAVMHGTIREVSLVLAGANPGALIDNVNIAHSDGSLDTLDDEAIIYTGLPIAHSEESTETMGNKTIGDIFDALNDEQKGAVSQMLESALAHAEDDDKDKKKVDADKKDDKKDDKDSGSDEKTVKQIFDGMTEEQKNVVYFMIGQALDDAKAEKTETKSSSESDETKSTAKHDNFSEGSTTMSHNVFDKDAVTGADTTPALSHADSASIFEGAKRLGSIKEAAEDYALQHGIEDIDVLFPDAKAISSTPEFIARRTEWVSEVMTGTRKTPFSRIKSLTANLTLEEARAKGYIKGNLKKEEFFRVAKRVTTPQTIYKKQKLDRDDILDITDFDVVAWLKGEMRLMLEEEIARAVLLGDGRSAGDDDKISEDHVRPIANEDELYVTYLYVNTGGAEYTAEEIIDSLTLQRRHYRGSGNPTFFTSETVLAQLLLIKDKMGRRIYPTVNDLSAALRVSKIVAVEVMDEPSVDVLGVMVNLMDYTIGADKGGDVALFDDFDIDYNQYKYLIETRISGALVKAKSAVVIKAVAGGTLVRPTAPTWDDEDKTVTVPTVTGVTYKNKLTNATLTTASPVLLTPDEELTVIAVPASSSYYLSSSAEDEWMFDGDKGQVSGAF